MAGKAKARCVEPKKIRRKSQLPSYFPKKKKNRTLIVRLISTAQTGFFYTTQRPRTGPKLAAVKYDPRGNGFPAFVSFFVVVVVVVVVVLLYLAFFVFLKILYSKIVKQRVLFVESKKTKK
jgi:large subunit ribosomal protein L33